LRGIFSKAARTDWKATSRHSGGSRNDELLPGVIEKLLLE